MWLGREFTPVEAVKHVLAAMQPATDEATLVDAAEAAERDLRREDHGAVGIADRRGAIEHEVEMTSPVSGLSCASPSPRGRYAADAFEDMALLRRLAASSASCSRTSGCSGATGAGATRARAAAADQQVGAQGAARADQSALPVQRAERDRIADSHRPGRADEAVEQLAEVFRYTLRRSDSEWAPLDQELAFARAYLDVEQARFGQRLTCTIDSDHLPPAPQVPSMLLQTLIENAVKHGVSQARGPGRIDVVVRTTSPIASPSKCATRVPAAGARGVRPREGEGFGLRSVRERLHGHFGDRASCRSTRDEPAGMTVARIVMPVVGMAA